MIADEQRNLAFLREEAREAPEWDGPLYEPIGGGLCRLHLGKLRGSGISLETVHRFFVTTALHSQGEPEGFAQKLEQLQRMCQQGELPFSGDDCQIFLEAYRRKGCPAIHHSQAFRQAYQPHYRVVSQAFAQYHQVFCLIEQLLQKKSRPILAIDGCSGSGKSYLAALLEQVYGNSTVHMDDFFLQPVQRTPQRLAEPGGNIDWERFQNDILPALQKRDDFAYQAFDCRKQEMGMWKNVKTSPLLVVEGVYSMHPALREAYDGAVFLQVPRPVQLQRIERRSGPLLERFQREWIPMEDRYFQAFQVEAACDVRVDGMRTGE